MPKSNAAWDPSGYATVAERITAFYAAFPHGRIVTELASRTERQVTFRALVYRAPDEPEPAATGWASEREGDGEINAVACLENAETSAIGRALANLGFSAARAAAAPVARPRRSDAPVRLVREAEPPVADDAAAASEFAALQRHADAIVDALLLVEEAARAGLDDGRVRRHRATLMARSVPPSVLVRVERELRAWFEERFQSTEPVL